MKIILKDNVSVKDYQEIHLDAGWKMLSDEQVEKALKNSMVVVGIEVDGKVVGMGRLVGDYAIKGLLCDIIVKKEYQQKGIGKMIVNEIVRKTKEIIKDNLFMIEVLPTTNNRDFYIKLGFKYKPENMDGVYMWFNK